MYNNKKEAPILKSRTRLVHKNQKINQQLSTRLAYEYS